MRTEVEELLEGEEVLVGLLPPLAEADEHEVLLQVTFLFGERVQPRVLDRHRGLYRQGLRALHLLWREPTVAVALGQDRRADGLLVHPQRQRPQRLDAKRFA